MSQVARARRGEGLHARARSRWRGCSPSSRGSCRSPAPAAATAIEENAGATQVALSADDVADLDALAARVGVQGDRYNPAGMAMVGL